MQVRLCVFVYLSHCIITRSGLNCHVSTRCFLNFLFPLGSVDSDNTAVTLSALLASLNSCCNPWIYMIFSGHLLQDFVHCLPCCVKMNTDFKKEDSDSSLRRTTLLSKMTNRSPTASSGIWRELDNSPKSSNEVE